MSIPAQPNPSPAGDERDPAAQPAPISLGFEENLRVFWAKYAGLVLGLCTLVLVAIVGYHGWEWLQERRTAARAEAYAAATTPAQLQSFAAEYAQTELGGLAHLRLADEAFKAGRWAEAQTGYERARDVLAGTPFAGRARLGVAVSLVRSGQTAPGRAALQEILADTVLTSAVRAEAGYHLASLAAAEGATEDVVRLVDQITAVEATGLWAQRATMLRATVAPAAPAGPSEVTSPVVAP